MLPSRRPSGFGFFPVCEGTWNLPPNPPHKRLLFLGQDFGDKSGVLPDGESTEITTWMRLEPLLHEVKANAECCFFSNLIMGVRVPSAKQTGPSPGLSSLAYRMACARFLVEQVAVVKPYAIVVMGMEGMPVLRLAVQTIPYVYNYVDWDLATKRRPISVQIGDWGGPLILLVHPCYRHVNTKRRSLLDPSGREEGHAFEVGLFKSVM